MRRWPSVKQNHTWRRTPRARHWRAGREQGLHTLLSDVTHLFQVLVSQLDGEQQLPGSIEVAEYPAGQDVGFI